MLGNDPTASGVWRRASGVCLKRSLEAEAGAIVGLILLTHVSLMNEAAVNGVRGKSTRKNKAKARAVSSVKRCQSNTR